MKRYVFAAVLSILSSQSSRATFFERHSYYFHNPSFQMIEPYNFNENTGTAVYFDRTDGKKKTVKISDLSIESNKPINKVRQGELVLMNKEGHNFCETFHVFENGMAYIGCQTNKVQEKQGKERAKNIHYYAPTEILIPEVKSIDGFRKKDKVRLAKNAGQLDAGTLVRIEALFPNGEALVQKMGVNLLDSSSLRFKFNIERVHLTDIELNLGN
jgi:hypothetical protein